MFGAIQELGVPALGRSMIQHYLPGGGVSQVEKKGVTYYGVPNSRACTALLRTARLLISGNAAYTVFIWITF